MRIQTSRRHALLEAVELADLLEQSTAAGTRRAYTSDWASFRDWTERHRSAHCRPSRGPVAL